MPLSVDDEVFVEKCFQRSLLVCLFLLPKLFCQLTGWTGIGQADIIQRDSYCSMETDGGDLSRRA
jgi:hypothetical protein